MEKQLNEVIEALNAIKQAQSDTAIRLDSMQNEIQAVKLQINASASNTADGVTNADSQRSAGTPTLSTANPLASPFLARETAGYSQQAQSVASSAQAAILDEFQSINPIPTDFFWASYNRGGRFAPSP